MQLWWKRVTGTPHFEWSHNKTSITLPQLLICFGESFLNPLTKIQNAHNKSVKEFGF